MTSLARSERAALCDLFLQVGPDAPTLCGDWTSRDLAAHLVIREARPDAGIGILVGPVAGWTRRVQSGVAKQEWPALVERVRSGPPWWSPVRVGKLDAIVNTAEFFVHHEDVRRAVEGWTAREPSERADRTLWSVVRQRARFHLRHSPVGVLVRTPDGRELATGDAQRRVALVGAPGELVLYLYGRTQHCQVEVQGDPDLIAAFEGTDLSV